MAEQQSSSAVAPNASVLVGPDVVERLLAHFKGSMAALCACSASRLRHIGRNDGTATGSSGRTEQQQQQFLHAGFLAAAPLVAEVFGSDVVAGTENNPKRKFVDMLGKKLALALHVDGAMSRQDGNYGRELRQELLKGTERYRDEGKTSAVDQKALAVPFVPSHGDSKKTKRGGRKEFLKRHRNGEALTEVEKAANVVAFGVSEEVQAAEFASSRNVVALAEGGRAGMMNKARRVEGPASSSAPAAAASAVGGQSGGSSNAKGDEDDDYADLDDIRF